MVGIEEDVGPGAALFRPRKVRHIELKEDPLPRRLRSFVRVGAVPST